MAILGKGIMGPREVSYAGSNYSSSQTSLLGSKRSRVIAELAAGNLDEDVLKQRLEAGVERFDAESALLAQLENADSGSTREKVSIIPVPYSDISPDASKRFCLERSTSNVSNTAFSPESNVATDNKSVIDLSQDSNGSADTVMDNICPSTPLSKQKDHSGISEAPNKRWLTINGMKGVLVMIPSLKIESM